MADRSQPDANNIHSLIAVSTADGFSPVTLWADPVTHSLVTSGSGGASGTQYTQGGATVANPTGTAQIYFDGSGNPKAVTPSTPLPVSQTDGTNSPNILKSDGTSAGQNALFIAGTYREVTFTTSAAGAQSIATTDASGYRHAVIHVTAAGVGLAYTFQESNDNSNWFTVPARNLASTSNAWSSGSQSTGLNALEVNLKMRYFRINITAMTSGTTSGIIELYAIPPAPDVTSASQNGTWSVGSNSATGSAVPANAFYTGMLTSAGQLIGMTSLSGIGVDGTTGSSILSTGSWIFNGTTWDRIRQATIAAGTTGTGVPAAGMLGFDGTNYQRVKTDVNGVTGVQLLNGVTAAAFATDNADAIGVSGTASRLVVIDRNTVFNGTSWDRMRGDTTGTYTVPRPTTSGGVTVAKIASAATTNATSVKATAGQVYGWSLFNTSAATKYLKFYNKATAPTVGTDVPVFIVPIPASGSVNIMLGDLGTPLATGIAYAITGAVADTDTTAVALNDVVGSVFYN